MPPKPVAGLPIQVVNDKGRYHSRDRLRRETSPTLFHVDLVLERAFLKIVLDIPMDEAHVTVSRDDETASGSLDDPRWSAPYYWAAFVLQGEWK